MAASPLGDTPGGRWAGLGILAAMVAFTEKLLAASRKNQSLLCVGLDPDPALMPKAGLVEFTKAIIEATKDLVCAYKPNLAFYEALGLEGLRGLERTLAAIPSDIPVIGDAKRGDMANTATFYAKALFEVWGFDAATVNPYQGRDALEPFLAYHDRGVLILCRTSNPGSADLQSLATSVADGGGAAMPLYERVAHLANACNGAGNVGLVVGATMPAELRRVREVCPAMPILIPGVGAQGGDVKDAVRFGADAQGELAIVNTSRQVLYASRGADFAEAARRAAQQARDALQAARVIAAG